MEINNNNLKKLLDYNKEEYYFSTIENLVEMEASRGRLSGSLESVSQLKEEGEQRNQPDIIRVAKDANSAIERFLAMRKKLEEEHEDLEQQGQRNHNHQKRLDEGV
jgi:hypothetical protein